MPPRFKYVWPLIAVAALWANNSSLLVAPHDRTPRLIAHRGVHHIYAGPDRNADTCRAKQVEPITHSYIENTLPSITAAHDFGADVVEIDVHPSTDGHLAVFHDWTLECQTNGTGRTRDHSMPDLRQLDLGHNISENGTDFPLRGTGINQLLSLKDVLAERPGPKLLINFKGNDPEEAKRLIDLLDVPENRAQIFAVYGGRTPTNLAMSEGLAGFHRKSLTHCLVRYALLGWSGHVPNPCRTGLIAVPMNIAPWLWGWPDRFTHRMARHQTEVILWGPYDGSGFSSGIDDLDTLAHVPEHFDGLIWTNRIQRIGPALP